MESLLQNFEEFPIDLVAIYLFFIFLFLITAKCIRPRFPCRYKKPLAVIYLLSCLWTVHITDSDIILREETLSSLEQHQGILKFIEIKKGQHGGYFLYSQDGKKRRHLSFILCSHIDPDLYLHQKVIIWHRKGYVYQISINQDIIDTLEDSNRKIWLANLSNLMFCFLIFSVMLLPYFFILRSLNSYTDRK